MKQVTGMVVFTIFVYCVIFEREALASNAGNDLNRIIFDKCRKEDY